MSKNCTIREKTLMEKAIEQYNLPENDKLFKTASEVEKTGYCVWPRLKETVEFCRRMNYKKIGVAFCMGLHKEAKVVSGILRQYDLEVVAVICKAGGYGKGEIGIPNDHQISGGETFESMCNPIAQAELLNHQQTEFNIVMGLCIGHDSLFYKYSKAMTTSLVVKDRVLAHNPAGAIYCADGYIKRKLSPDWTK